MNEFEAKIINLLSGTEIDITIKDTISELKIFSERLEKCLNNFNRKRTLNSLEKLERDLQGIFFDIDKNLTKPRRFFNDLSDSIYDFKESFCYEVKNVVKNLNPKEE